MKAREEGKQKGARSNFERLERVKRPSERVERLPEVGEVGELECDGAEQGKILLDLPLSLQQLCCR